MTMLRDLGNAPEVEGEDMPNTRDGGDEMNQGKVDGNLECV